MDAYIFQADVYCVTCADVLMEDIRAAGGVPANPEDESSYESDDFPKGPFPDAGGESDCPQHCAACGVYLEAPLTPSGVTNALDALDESDVRREPLDTWAADLHDYSLDDAQAAILDAYDAKQAEAPTA